MSELLEVNTFAEWSAAVPELGIDGLVGVVLTVDRINPSDFDNVFWLAAREIARGDSLPNLPDTALPKRKIAKLDHDLTGAHVHPLADHPRTVWANDVGTVKWSLLDPETTDIEGIEETMEKATTRVEESANLPCVDALFKDKKEILELGMRLVEYTFDTPAIFGFPSSAGKIKGEPVNPAIHQVENQVDASDDCPTIATRVSYATTSAAFLPYALGNFCR